MQAIINGYCPFVAYQRQIYQFVFDSTTFDILPRTTEPSAVQGYEVDGLYLREDNIMRSNLLFVKVRRSVIVCCQYRSWWDGTQTTDSNDIYIHYAWT